VYYRLITQCVESLAKVDLWLEKAQTHATSKRFDIDVLMNDRLAPDMKPFIYQVQSACDYVKAGAAWLSGQTPPKHDDTEVTADELRERINKTIAFVRSVHEQMYSGADQRSVKLSWRPGQEIFGADYVTQVTLPNVYFHLAVAYAILRKNGIDVGKMKTFGQRSGRGRIDSLAGGGY
jgi:hypothetical protein